MSSYWEAEVGKIFGANVKIPSKIIVAIIQKISNDAYP
jgi:hypothetical protein